MLWFDRLYGRMVFPPLIREALNCPGLMRLREVRLANTPFLGFPSFSGVSRYEHSLGVCYLAGACAESLRLADAERHELMLAALYHDAATPPFAHVLEEILETLFGFKHEDYLRDLITGEIPLGRKRAGVFLGRGPKLRRICQHPIGRRLGLDPYRIADIAAGGNGNWLSALVNGRGMDLDNIDNVYRAHTSLGQSYAGPNPALRLSQAFVSLGDALGLDEAYREAVRDWQKARHYVYSLLYSNVGDLACQAMLKVAARTAELRHSDWHLSDDEFVHLRLLANQKSRRLVNRVRLGLPYSCLALIEVEGEARVSDQQLDAIVELASRIMRIRNASHGKDTAAPEVIAERFEDRRFREPGLPFVFTSSPIERPPCPTSEALGHSPTRPRRTLVGVFAASRRRLGSAHVSHLVHEISLRVFPGAGVSPYHSGMPRPGMQENVIAPQ